MRSPMGGTSCRTMSMRTSSAAPAMRRPQLVWQAYRDEAGNLKFKRIKERKATTVKAGPVDFQATVPFRVMGDQGRLRRLANALAGAGGSIVSANGRVVSVSAGAEDADGVGDVLDSFGCQWDAQQ